MALSKPKQLPSAVTIDYWRIIEINVNLLRSSAVVTLAGYISQSARDNGAAPLDAFSWDLGAAYIERLYSGADEIRDISLSEAYTEFKLQAQTADDPELTWFKDAQDA